MVSKYEQEELDKIQKEFEQIERIKENQKKQWRPWKWSWQTLLLWSIVAIMIRIIVAVINGG